MPHPEAFPPDVPTPIDFLRSDHARDWEASANVVRPWRSLFFDAFVSELRAIGREPLSVLDLGSGPGFLAKAITDALPSTRYTLLDFSPAMHQLARARLGDGPRAEFVIANMRDCGWNAGLPPMDAVVTLQAVHELRHRTRAPGLHRAVHALLRPGGVYLVCDHFLGEGGMANQDLYMSVADQREALIDAGFTDVAPVLQHESLVLHRARKSR